MQPLCFIGLPQWNHPEWHNGPLAGSSPVSALARYARYFSSVEGNTTFYGLPAANTVDDWYRETPAHFRFCFKLPKRISHDLALMHCDKELTQTIRCLSGVKEKLGMLCLQLPEKFTPQSLPDLALFLRKLPHGFNYSIEVRNLSFFDKSDNEKAFNQLLIEHQINRVQFDTRALFKHPSQDKETQDALNAKPKVPLHVIATGQQPMVRFITAKDWQGTLHYLDPWIKKIGTWLTEGRSPYVFLHTPNNAHAPDVALHFAERLSTTHPEQVLLSPWLNHAIEQDKLF
ncbi:MAG: DUF72 domain-containing protein [Pontibacterium sp.]